MLYDRRYMNRGGEASSDPGSGLKCLFAIIMANIVMFLVAGPGSPLQESLALFSGSALKEGMLWQPLTALFLHGSFSHVFFNMFGLYIFGSLVAPVLGSWRFLALYLFAGLAGNGLWLLFNLDSNAALLGASGAVMGVTIAAAMLAPDEQMLLLFFPFPIKLKTLAVVFVLIDVFFEILSPLLPSSVAYLAHVGGFLGGYLYMRVMQPQLVQWDLFAAILGKRRPGGWRIVTPPPPKSEPSGRVTQAELDRILDKLSATGINSLSEEEMETLRKAREQMKGPY